MMVAMHSGCSWCRFVSYLCPIFSYLAGTEEGHIHKCSCSYNEQYLESYFGHTVSVCAD